MHFGYNANYIQCKIKMHLEITWLRIKRNNVLFYFWRVTYGRFMKDSQTKKLFSKFNSILMHYFSNWYLLPLWEAALMFCLVFRELQKWLYINLKTKERAVFWLLLFQKVFVFICIYLCTLASFMVLVIIIWCLILLHSQVDLN